MSSQKNKNPTRQLPSFPTPEKLFLRRYFSSYSGFSFSSPPYFCFCFWITIHYNVQYGTHNWLIQVWSETNHMDWNTDKPTYQIYMWSKVHDCHAKLPKHDYEKQGVFGLTWHVKTIGHNELSIGVKLLRLSQNLNKNDCQKSLR